MQILTDNFGLRNRVKLKLNPVRLKTEQKYSADPNFRFTGSSKSSLKQYFQTMFSELPKSVSTLNDIKIPDLKKAIREIHLKAKDGASLYGWFLPPKKGMPTILFFPGYSGTLSKRVLFYEHFRKLGYGLLSYDYRGFGRSNGKPSERKFYIDAEAASDYLKNHKIPLSEQIVWANSMGNPIATYLASKHCFKAVILQSAFTKTFDLLSDVEKKDPLYVLFRNVFDSTQRMDKITSPLLILHGADDSNPVSMPKTLYNGATNSPEKLLVIFDGEGHKIDFNKYLPVVERFLKSL